MLITWEDKLHDKMTSAYSKSCGYKKFSVHTNTKKYRFQIVPLWRAFSESSVFVDLFMRISVDGSRIRNNKVAFSNLSGIVWRGLRKTSRWLQSHIEQEQKPITRSEHLPYLLLELSFLQTELFLERLSRQANNAFVYWPTRAPHYFCNKWINYLDFPTFINMADSSDEFESDLSFESEYESVESSDEWESSAILDPPLIAP